MRENAFKIMSKTFGGVSKETKEPVYDQYPLKELVRLLCFENLDEARSACQHYGITVKEMKLKSPIKTTVAEIISWKKSQFKIPKDPLKGTVKTLLPRKMLRTIEVKVHGATRLAVCRGEVSLFGGIPSSQVRTSEQHATATRVAAALPKSDEGQEAALLAIKQQEAKRKEREAREKEESDKEKARREVQRKRELERIKRLEEEQERQLAEAQTEERRRQQEELERHQEAQRLAEEKEKLRIQQEQEAARREAEEEQLRIPGGKDTYRNQVSLCSNLDSWTSHIHRRLYTLDHPHRVRIQFYNCNNEIIILKF